jgi:hypothetical protein
MLDKMIAALEAKKYTQSVSDERFIRQQRILDDLAPRVWRKLREAFQSECKRHPEHLNFETQPEQLVQIRCANGGFLVVEYLSEARTVVFQCGEAAGEWVIGLCGDGRAAIFDGDGKPMPSEAYLADELLTLALQPR